MRCTGAILASVSEALRDAPRLPTLPAEACETILAWYAANGRQLAFRRTTDPWAILVSEVVAQQTQAARAAERWERFMARFPTLERLAAATPAEVLREWQGLGYDRRGLRLQQAARALVSDHHGRVPERIDALAALPGIGPYTARAVAAIAFGQAVGAVDVNVRRVLGRLLAGDPALLTAAEMQRLADDTVPAGRSAAWTHAVMDLGALICRPQTPRCGICPVVAWCRSATAVTGTRVVPRPKRSPDRTPFAATNRWLRGRILDRLRAAPDRHWVALKAPIGTHDAATVRRAVQALARDGMLELEAADGDVLRARLPV